MTNVAANVRAHKEKHPELYCPNSRCLWRTGGGYCPRHNYKATFGYPKRRNEPTGE